MAGKPKPRARRPKREQVQLTASRCPKCGSTERTNYHNKSETEYRGQWKGEPCTHLVRRRTECLACGQHRVDIVPENRTQTNVISQSDDTAPRTAARTLLNRE